MTLLIYFIVMLVFSIAMSYLYVTEVLIPQFKKKKLIKKSGLKTGRKYFSIGSRVLVGDIKITTSYIHEFGVMDKKLWLRVSPSSNPQDPSVWIPYMNDTFYDSFGDLIVTMMKRYPDRTDAIAQLAGDSDVFK